MRLSLELACVQARVCADDAASMLCRSRGTALPDHRRSAPSEGHRRPAAFAGWQAGSGHRLPIRPPTAAKSHLWLVSDGGCGEAAPAHVFAAQPRSAANAIRSGLPMARRSTSWRKRGEQTQLFRLDLRGGEASPYELKIVPAVDQSKDKNAIPPPGAEKKEEDKTGAAEKETDKDGEAGRIRSCSPSMLPATPRRRTANGWRSGRNDPETPGEKKQKDAKADAVWVNHESSPDAPLSGCAQGGRLARRRA